MNEFKVPKLWNERRNFSKTVRVSATHFFQETPVSAAILRRVTGHFPLFHSPMHLYREKKLDTSSARLPMLSLDQTDTRGTRLQILNKQAITWNSLNVAACRCKTGLRNFPGAPSFRVQTAVGTQTLTLNLSNHDNFQVVSFIVTVTSLVYYFIFDPTTNRTLLDWKNPRPAF